MTDLINTLEKIANLPKILKAAQFLDSFGLLTERPERLLRDYVENNPDINEHFKTFSQ